LYHRIFKYASYSRPKEEFSTRAEKIKRISKSKKSFENKTGNKFTVKKGYIILLTFIIKNSYHTRNLPMIINYSLARSLSLYCLSFDHSKLSNLSAVKILVCFKNPCREIFSFFIKNIAQIIFSSEKHDNLCSNSNKFKMTSSLYIV
jgi:hypothetical protein